MTEGQLVAAVLGILAAEDLTPAQAWLFLRRLRILMRPA